MKKQFLLTKLIVPSIILLLLGSCNAQLEPTVYGDSPLQHRLPYDGLSQTSKEALEVAKIAMAELYPATYNHWSHGELDCTIEYFTTDDFHHFVYGYQPQSIDTVMYIINLSNNQGFVLINDSLELMGISADGNIFKRDFTDFPTDIDFIEDAPRCMITGMALNDLYVRHSIATTVVPPSGPEDYYAYPIDSVVITPWTATQLKGPFVEMKIGQGEPYNIMCFNDNGNQAKVGCVAVAIANVFSANRFPDFITASWDSIVECWNSCNSNHLFPMTYTGLTNRPHLCALAYNLNLIGNAVDMDYGTDRSGASNYKAMKYFQRVGYKNVSRPEASKVDIKNLIYQNKTLYISAFDSINTNRGHAWVIDGIASFTQFRNVYRHGSVSESRKLNSMYGLVHCNFGWDGDCDGYYKYGFFNTKEGPIIPDTECGCTNDRNYAKLQKVIVYDF